MDIPEDNTESEDSGIEEEVESDVEFHANLEYAFGQVQIDSNDENEADQHAPDNRQRRKSTKIFSLKSLTDSAI